MAQTLKKTYQLKISLRGTKPPIWRRFLIENTVTLAKFHQVIQIVMGWTDSHLHHFMAGNEFYGIPDLEFDDGETLDENKFKLNQLLIDEKDSLIYEYDFGDGWEHKIMLEKILAFDPKPTLPNCIKAKGACPPEDVGGVWGYYNFLEALKNPDHPEHEEYKEWGGGDFDPDAYDLQEVNGLLSKVFR